MIGDIKKFRFWCQKVIPLIYDNSLSYYEVLCKVVDYLNKVIEDINEVPAYIDAKIAEALDDEHLRKLLEELVANIENAISSNNEHDNTNSSTDYEIGQMLWWNGKLYKVIRHIDAGDTFIVNTNIELDNFEDLFNDFVDEVKHDISANDDGTSATATQSWTAGTWLWLDNVLYIVKSDITEGNAYVFEGENANVEQITVEGEMHKEATARANEDIAIRQYFNNAVDVESNTRLTADTALQNAIDAEAIARASADTALQNAINAEATTRANADTELTGYILAREIKQSSRKYILIFDSYGALGISALAASACAGGAHVLNIGGAGFCGAGGGTTWVQEFSSYLASISEDERNSYTDVMVFGGINDYGYLPNAIISAMTDFNTAKNNYVPQCKVTLCPVSWATRADGTISDYADHVITAYSLGSAHLGWEYVDGLNAFIHSDIYLQSDGIHPTSAGAERLGEAIATFIKTGMPPMLSTPVKNATFTPANDGISASTFKTLISKNKVKLNGAIVLSYSTPVTINSGYTKALNLGKLSDSYFQGNVITGAPANIVTIPAYIHNTVSGVWELKAITIQVYYFFVFISVEGGNITFDGIQTPLFTIDSDLNMA